MKIRFLLFALLLYCFQVQAQTIDSAGIASGNERISKKGWVKPVIGAGYAAITYACYRFMDSRIQRASQDHQSGFSRTVSRSVSDFGLGKFQNISLVSTSILAFVSKNKKLKRTVITWGGALLINTIVTDVMKEKFQRLRPNSGLSYNQFGDGKEEWMSGSFPSAHTSNAFTTATVFATVYRDKKWVPFAAYGLAGLVGLSRIHDNAHWASDVLAGAAIGFLSAKASHALYKLGSRKMQFMPQVGSGYAGISMVYRFP
jgi:membrane-associated phospholipid phosphatase